MVETPHIFGRFEAHSVDFKGRTMRKPIITLLSSIVLMISVTASAAGVRYQDGIVVEKLQPRVREISSGHGVDIAGLDYYRLFMQHPHILSERQDKGVARLIQGDDERMLISRGERVYAYGVEKPGQYLVYRAVGDIVDPQTNKILGRQVLFSGIVSTLPYTNSALEGRSAADAAYLKNDEYYTRVHPLLKVPTETAQPMVVEEAVSEIRHGDYLLPLPDDWRNITLQPHEPQVAVNGVVVGVMDGIRHAGQFQTVMLNLGEADGIDNGAVLGIYRQGRQTKVALEDNGKSIVKYVSIPAEEIGRVLVYQVGEKAAAAIVLSNQKEIRIGDVVALPGRDLDNMLQDGRHVPN